MAANLKERRKTTLNSKSWRKQCDIFAKKLWQITHNNKKDFVENRIQKGHGFKNRK